MITKGAIFTGNIKAANVIKTTAVAKKHKVELPEDYFIDMGTLKHGNNISNADLAIIENLGRLLNELNSLSPNED